MFLKTLLIFGFLALPIWAATSPPETHLGEAVEEGQRLEQEKTLRESLLKNLNGRGNRKFVADSPELKDLLTTLTSDFTDNVEEALTKFGAIGADGVASIEDIEALYEYLNSLPRTANAEIMAMLEQMSKTDEQVADEFKTLEDKRIAKEGELKDDERIEYQRLNKELDRRAASPKFKDRFQKDIASKFASENAAPPSLKAAFVLDNFKGEKQAPDWAQIAKASQVVQTVKSDKPEFYEQTRKFLDKDNRTFSSLQTIDAIDNKGKDAELSRAIKSGQTLNNALNTIDDANVRNEVKKLWSSAPPTGETLGKVYESLEKGYPGAEVGQRKLLGNVATFLEGRGEAFKESYTQVHSRSLADNTLVRTSDTKDAAPAYRAEIERRASHAFGESAKEMESGRKIEHFKGYSQIASADAKQAYRDNLKTIDSALFGTPTDSAIQNLAKKATHGGALSQAMSDVMEPTSRRKVVSDELKNRYAAAEKKSLIDPEGLEGYTPRFSKGKQLDVFKDIRSGDVFVVDEGYKNRVRDWRNASTVEEREDKWKKLLKTAPAAEGSETIQLAKNGNLYPLENYTYKNLYFKRYADEWTPKSAPKFLPPALKDGSDISNTVSKGNYYYTWGSDGKVEEQARFNFDRAVEVRTYSDFNKRELSAEMQRMRIGVNETGQYYMFSEGSQDAVLGADPQKRILVNKDGTLTGPDQKLYTLQKYTKVDKTEQVILTPVIPKVQVQQTYSPRINWGRMRACTS